MKIHRVAAAALIAVVPVLAGACVPDPPAPVDPWVAAEGCYTYFNIYDVYFTGQVNVFGNAAFLTSSDGSCSGTPALDLGPAATNTFVEAADQGAADALCNSLDPEPIFYNAYQLATSLTPDFPIADMWSCNG
ncbi:hypothetical protein BH10ACT3_BH10ACT3_09710 [soil metagenome]